MSSPKFSLTLEKPAWGTLKGQASNWAHWTKGWEVRPWHVLLFNDGFPSDLHSLARLRTFCRDHFVNAKIVVARRVGEGLYDVGVDAPHGDRFRDPRQGLDLNQLSQYAIRHGVRWIAPTVHARSELVAAELADRLLIPWASPQAARTCIDKQRTQKLRRELGLPVPHSVPCATRDEIRAAIAEIRGPYIIKPTSGFASLAGIVGDSTAGVSNRDEDHIEEHLETLRRLGWGQRSLVQALVRGQEWGVTALVEDGRPIFFMPTLKDVTEGRYRRVIGHVFDPFDPEHQRVERLIWADLLLFLQGLDQVEEGRAGMMRSFFNADVIVTSDEEVVLLDASTRMGGNELNKIANAAIGLSCGQTNTFEEKCFLWAAMMEVGFSQPPRPVRAALYRKAFVDGGQPITGGPVYPGGPEELPGIFHISDEGWEDLAKGKRLRPMETLDTVGHPGVGAEGESRAEAESRWYDCLRRMGLVLALPDGRTTGYGPDGPWTNPPLRRLSSPPVEQEEKGMAL